MNGRAGGRWRQVALVGGLAVVGWCLGWVIGSVLVIRVLAGLRSDRFEFLAERVALPHHVPEHPGGASLRFAMVQDVLTERFARHAPEFYAERNRLVAEKLGALVADDPARLPLLDDLGVGLERLGKSREAVRLLRDKLAEQRRAGLTGRDLYTTYANLGTVLIHASLGPATRGDQPAREEFKEGIAFIHQAVAVNPAAHFGRERWQAAIAEFLLAALADPQVLRTFDCLGNRLDLPIESILNREAH